MYLGKLICVQRFRESDSERPDDQSTALRSQARVSETADSVVNQNQARHLMPSHTNKLRCNEGSLCSAQVSAHSDLSSLFTGTLRTTK